MTHSLTGRNILNLNNLKGQISNLNAELSTLKGQISQIKKSFKPLPPNQPSNI